MAGRYIVYGLICALLAGCTVNPEPFSEAELQDQAAIMQSRATAYQEPVTRPIGLREAMARALKYNLNTRVKALEAALKLRQLELSSADMLPDLAANLDFTARNNDSGASSRSLITGKPSLEVSTSTDRQIATSDLRLSWNILDFGLSYVRAQQAADQALIARENRRKAVQMLLQDVRAAFWRAVAADNLMREIARLEPRIAAVIRDEQALEKGGASSPLTALTRQRDVIDLQIDLQRLSRELGSAKAQLAALMNLPPGTDFQLSTAGAKENMADTLPPARQMTAFALVQRPELRQAGYSSRVNEHDAQAALLELLPGIAPFLSANFDSNSFAYTHNWVSAGARASWNLMKLFTYDQKQAAIEAEGEALDKKGLAMAMTVMMQVQVSRLEYAQAKKSFKIAQNLYDVERKIFQQLVSARDAGTIGEQFLVRQEMRMIAAAAKRDINFAEQEGALGTLLASLGMGGETGDACEWQPLDRLSKALVLDWRVAASLPAADQRQAH